MKTKKLGKITFMIHIHLRENYYQDFGFLIGKNAATLYFGFGFIQIGWREF